MASQGLWKKPNLFHTGKMLCLPDVTAAPYRYRDLPSQGRIQINCPFRERVRSPQVTLQSLTVTFMRWLIAITLQILASFKSFAL